MITSLHSILSFVDLLLHTGQYFKINICLHVYLFFDSPSAGGKIFDGSLRKGTQLVVDMYEGKAVDDVDKLEIEYVDQSYYQCEKNCISTHSTNKCKTCTVDESADDKPVFCNGGQLPLACKNRCCTEIAKPNKRINGKDVSYQKYPMKRP